MIVMDRENQAIATLKDQHIAFQDTIITKYSQLDKNNQTVDTNSQRIDALGQQNVQIFRDQHAEDKQAIASLTKDLESCRSNQKWIFGGGAIIGGFVGYKIRSSGTFQNPFVPTSNFQALPTNSEESLRKALKMLPR